MWGRMGKGLGMAVALQTATGNEVRADSTQGFAGPFQCLGCGVAVVHVDDYWINKQDIDLARHVKALFRLSRGKGNVHATDCRYTPAGQVLILVRESESVEDSINPFAQSGADGCYTFRINIPDTEVRRDQAEFNPADSDLTYGQRVERVWTGKRIAAFCRSAVGLAKLWQALESVTAQDDLRKRVRIALNGKRVSWDSFFYSSNAIGRFADVVEERRLKHPVAVLLNVKEVLPGRIIFTPMQDLTAPRDERIGVEAHGTPEALIGCELGHHYMVFGRFWYFGSRDYLVPNTDRRIFYRNVKVTLYRPSQIERVEVVDPMRD